MDPFTHALSGALLARATATPRDDVGLKRPGAANALPLRTRVAVGSLAAAFPDADIVLTWISPVTYLTQHRGLTHSWIMLPVWSVLLAWIVSRLLRDERGARPYFGVIALGIGIHILGDWITSFGTIMLAPLSDHRFALGTTFIIDLALTGIILVGLLGCVLWRRSRTPALIGLAAVTAYIAFQWLQQQSALAFGEQYARSRKLAQYQVAALPRPLSPFNWTIFVTADERYYVAHVNLKRSSTPPPAAALDSMLRQLSAPYRALHEAQWETIERFGGSDLDRALAREAWSQGAFGFYRWFAAFPRLDHVERGNPSACVWFRDARFDVPGRDMRLFRYGLCRETGQNIWRVFKLDDDGGKIALPGY
jgi:inner membrane protein